MAEQLQFVSSFFARYLMKPNFSLFFSAVSVVIFFWSQQALAQAILIGQTFVQTGPLASLSEQPLLGIRAKIAAVNAAGGVNGRLIELRQLDDGADTAKAYDNVKKLIEDGAVGILMPIGTISSLGALKAAN